VAGDSQAVSIEPLDLDCVRAADSWKFALKEVCFGRLADVKDGAKIMLLADSVEEQHWRLVEQGADVTPGRPEVITARERVVLEVIGKLQHCDLDEI
jgi:hypothetical protein